MHDSLGKGVDNSVDGLLEYYIFHLIDSERCDSW